MSDIEYQKINEYIKEYLKYNKYNSTLECLEAEERMFKVTSKTKSAIKIPDKSGTEEIPKMYQVFDGEAGSSQREKSHQTDVRSLQNKLSGILQSARQIFSITINCIQHLDQLKDGNIVDNLNVTVDNYKIQLGKYHKILLLDLKQNEN